MVYGNGSNQCICRKAFCIDPSACQISHAASLQLGCTARPDTGIMKKSRRSSSESSVPRPTHWPPDIQYVSRQCYHTSVSKDILSQIFPAHAQVADAHSPALRPVVIIRDIVEEGHPARGQRGLFATRKIPPRTHILDYAGEVHCDDRPESDYDLSLYRSATISVAVDASRMGNEARFINDYRGVRQKPNALFQERQTPFGELCMSIWSGREGIKKGEEILVSYGKGFWSARAAGLTTH